MRKRLISIFISTALVISMITGAAAADPAAMQDIDGHWAKDHIVWGMEQGLFNGTGDTTFEPDIPMSRGMFVVVLGRIAEDMNQDDYKNDYLQYLYSDVKTEDYFAPYVNWATRYGIVNGFEDGTFRPNDSITREQMATMVIRFTSNCGYILNSVEGEYVAAFSDLDQISDWAVTGVESLRNVGLLNGFKNDDGSYYFDPQKTASRAESAAMFQRVKTALHQYEENPAVEPVDFQLAETSAEMKVGQTMPMIATIEPEDASLKTITWVSMNPTVATVNYEGTVTAVGVGTAEIRGYTWNGLEVKCTVTCTGDASLAYAGETYEEKCIRIFGQRVDNYRTFYDIEDTSYLVNISVRVWDFTDSSRTTKTTKTMWLQVHANIAETVKAIFEEIYNGPEKFPIHSAGGYYKSSYSEHDPGLAIDLNVKENYECYLDGRPMSAGEYWKPGEDEYSIPPDGDVVRAFKKYGFGWGGDWRTKKDYMHFSYFST